MKKQLLILMTLVITSFGYSQTFTDNFITYNVTSTTNNTVEITDYDAVNGGTSVTIPDAVNYNSQSYVVVVIANNAFYNKGLTSVVIGSNIVSIGLNAFRENSLTSVVIPDDVISIGDTSFFNNDLNTVIFGISVEQLNFLAFGNNQLTSIDLPESLVNIGWRVFEGNSISSVILPSNVSNIGLGAFRYNPLTCVTSEATTPPSIVTESTLNDTFSSNRSNINLTIPSGTSSAYSSASWTGFNSVIESDFSSVFTVDYITYQINSSNNNQLTITDYDTIGGTVVNIPATVTRGCEIYSVTEIASTAFLQKGLTSVEIPATITTIGSAAFFDNMNLTSVTFQDGLVSIGDNTFNSCGLTNVIIPSTVVNIGNFAFFSNPLTDVTSLSITPPTITTGTNDTFSNNRSNIHLHIPPGTMGAYVTNPGALWTGFNPVTEDALSIDEFELSSNVKVITTFDAIKIIASNNLQLQYYTIYNMSGAQVASGNKSEISSSFLARGMYILKIEFDKGTAVRKVIIN